MNIEDTNYDISLQGYEITLQYKGHVMKNYSPPKTNL